MSPSNTSPVEFVEVRHNPAASRFEARVDGELARADYRLDGRVMRLTHTEVPVDLEGRGIAAQLVRAALTHAESKKLFVMPACSYVRAYMRNNPETKSLLPPGTSL